MKKQLLVSLFICLVPFFIFAQDTLIGWTFPSATKADSLANFGLSINKTQALHLKSDSMIMYITKTYATPPACAQAMGLSNGTAGEKGWYISLNSTGYTNLKLYSKQQACPMHSGPKYWKIQYKSGTGSWTDITNGSITCSLNWLTAVKSNLALPAASFNNASLSIRWIMVSDSNVAGASHGTTIVTDSSMSRIDDIFILGDKIMPGFDTIVGWNFPTATKSDSVANYGITANKSRVIHLKSDSMIMYLNKTYASPPACAQAMGLSNGTNLEKGWYIDFTTSGYDHLMLFSKQQACPMHSGPKYWKVQYKLPSGTWTDIPNGNITNALNWTKGVLNGIALPSACENTTLVSLRWIMVSDSNVAGASMGTPVVTDGSMSRIDDIFVIGKYRTSIENPASTGFVMYPVPSENVINLDFRNKPQAISIYNTVGMLVYENNNPGLTNTIDLSNFGKGIFLVKIKTSSETFVRKAILR